MKNNQSIVMLILALLITGVTGYILPTAELHPQRQANKIRSVNSPKAPVEAKAARWEYFHRLLKDPATGRIPANIREKELQHAAALPRVGDSGRRAPEALLSWNEIGPIDVGGRTRALAVDVTNSNVLIAGGISGGIWKSTNKGATWEMKSQTDQLLSVTWVTQDTRPGHTHKWYYTTGEFAGNSATDHGSTASFRGHGIYRSTDNGESWHRLPAGATDTPDQWDGPFDFASKILVHPNTGSIFVASNGFGIIRSQNDGDGFSVVLGGSNDHRWADLVIASDGTLFAAITPGWNDTPQNSYGVYKSTNDGDSWSGITPTSYLEGQRMVLASSKSNPAILYALNFTGTQNQSTNREIVQLFRINVANSTYNDLSSNLPDFGNDYEDFVNTQGSYNMALAVKPDDPNLVLIGATSIFRSIDAFNSKPNSTRIGLIGGYWPASPWRYPNLHPDTHILTFDPNNPNVMYAGHDGGISYVSDISNTSHTNFLPWQSLNNGYNVTQFYTIAIPDQAGDDRFVGGAQDNGTPFFSLNGSSIDASSGDGAYCQFTESYLYTSTQNGAVTRQEYDNGNAQGWDAAQMVFPSGAEGKLFINPFIIDPSNENLMYYPAGQSLWRNIALSAIPDGEPQEGTSVGWSTIAGAELPNGMGYTTVGMARNAPGDILYTGAYDYNGDMPRISRFNNASTTASPPVNITSNQFPQGGYPHSIAVNPDNPDEIIVAFSNYNIDGLFHSTNGGSSYTIIEGNLTNNGDAAGPSIRTAWIQPTANGTVYFVGTSTGVYSTTSLNGSNTTWELEGANTIGNVVVEYLTGRTSDGKIVAATHGRGAFQAFTSAAGAPEATASANALDLAAVPGGNDDVSFTLTNSGNATMNYTITAQVNWPARENSATIPVLAEPVPSGLKPASSRSSADTSVPFSTAGSGGTLPQGYEEDDVLYLDDGNAEADLFLGYDSGNDFMWMNKFELSSDFLLKGFHFYMRTESAGSNSCIVRFYDGEMNVFADGTISLDTSPDGSWFSISLNTPRQMNNGETFYVSVQTNGSGIQFPAGFDYNATTPNQSYYVVIDTGELVNVNTIGDYANGAFLLRPFGESGSGGGNVAPVITITPPSGNLGVQQSASVNVAIRANDLANGVYSGNVTVNYTGGQLQIPLTVTIDPSTSVEDAATVPAEYALEQNYPNPFNPSTTISFSLKEQGFVEINLFSISGELVRTITSANYGAGRHEVTFHAGGLSSGVYLYTMRSNEFFATKKMILMK